METFINVKIVFIVSILFRTSQFTCHVAAGTQLSSDENDAFHRNISHSLIQTFGSDGKHSNVETQSKQIKTGRIYFKQQGNFKQNKRQVKLNVQSNIHLFDTLNNSIGSIMYFGNKTRVLPANTAINSYYLTDKPATQIRLTEIDINHQFRPTSKSLSYRLRSPWIVSSISSSLSNARRSRSLTSYLENPLPTGIDHEITNKMSHHLKTSTAGNRLSSPTGRRTKRTVLAEMTIRDPVAKLGNMARLTRVNSTLKESKIAAIFRGVAYGIPTEDPLVESGPLNMIPEVLQRKPTFDVSENWPSQDLNHLANQIQIPKTNQDATDHYLVNNRISSSQEETRIEHIEGDNLPHLVVEYNKNLFKSKDTVQETESLKMENNYEFNNNFVSGNEINDFNLTSVNELEKTEISETKFFDNVRKQPDNLKTDLEILNNTSMFSNWSEVKFILGMCWPIHVHSSTCIYGIIAVISLYQLSLGKIWHNISPILFMLFYISMIAVSALRSASYFLDAYGAEDSLSIFAVMFIWNLATVFLLSVSAIFLLVLIKTSSFSLSLLPPTVVITTCVLHLLSCLIMELSTKLMSINWLRNELYVYFEMFTASWGLIISVAYAILLNRIERKDTIDRKTNDPTIQRPPRLKRAARLSIIAASCHIILSTIIIISIALPEVPTISISSTHVWIWFTRQCIARTLEVLSCISLLFASKALVHYKQGDCPPTQNSNLCSLLAKCCVNRAAGVHPATKRSLQQFTVFTLHNPPTSYDYATNDFQLVWNKSRPNEQDKENTRQHSSKEFNSFESRTKPNLPPMKFVSTMKNSNSVFTPDELYNSPISKSTTGLYDNIQIEQISKLNDQNFRPYLQCKGFYVNNYRYVGATLPNRSTLNKRITHEINDDINETGSISGFGSSYWTPHQDSSISLRRNNSINERGASSSIFVSTVAGVPVSSCRSVDYLSAGGPMDDLYLPPLSADRREKTPDEGRNLLYSSQYPGSQTINNDYAPSRNVSNSKYLCLTNNLRSSNNTNSSNTIRTCQKIDADASRRRIVRGDFVKNIKKSSPSEEMGELFPSAGSRWTEPPVHTLPLKLPTTPRRTERFTGAVPEETFSEQLGK